MKKLLALATTAAALIMPATAVAATVGTTNVYLPVTSNAVGLAQIYRFTAPSTGSVNRLNVFLDATSTASKVELGLYSGGALKARCVVTQPQANAWNRCSTAAYSVTAGGYYWLALLQPAGSTGRLQYREGQVSGGPVTYGSKSKSLASLPATWTNGAKWSGGYQGSIYADLVSAPDPTPTPTPTPTPPPPPAPVAGFSVNPDPAVRLSATTFSSTGSCAATPCTYRWFHGDASSSDEIEAGAAQPNGQAVFTYTGAAGPRTVTLKVVDNLGRLASVTRTFDLVEPAPAPSPSPSPSPSPVPVPVPVPGGFPDASSTGVPAGTTLTASGGLTINTAGTVVDARDISGPVVVNAPNVTIRRSRIRTNAMWVVENNSTGLVIEDSEIINRPVAGQPNCHNGIGSSNFTMRRTEITGCENAVNVGGDNITFEDNYVHDLDTTGPSYVWGNDPHTDGLQMSPGADNIVVRHNTIDPTAGGGATSAIIMGVNGSQANVWIENNYLDGRNASFAIYANRQPSSNININGNQMLRGVGGYTACVKLGDTVTQFNDNHDFATGALIAADNGVGGGCIY